MTVTESTQLPPSDADTSLYPERAPRMILEICRGLTRFPQRPVSGPRFFIGSGPGCDLRLGGDTFPTIHSLIQTRENGVWFEMLAADPPVRLNGEMTRGEWLRDGDRIEIGAFEFIAHVLPQLPPTSVGVTPSGTRRADEHLSELSAVELAERLEGEMGHVERFDRGRNAGAHALLQALKRQSRASQAASSAAVTGPRGASKTDSQHENSNVAWQSNHPKDAAEPAVSAAEAEFRFDLERLCRDLEELTMVLERRSETISHREIQFAKAAESMVEAQRELVSQLEAALETAARIRETQGEPVKPSIRVSA